MNASKLQPNSKEDQRAHARSEWGLMRGLLLAAAVVLVLASRGVPVSAAYQTPSAINNHLYVPSSVGGCDPARTSVMNNHLYVSCSVSGCPATRPAIINNHMYVPYSVWLGERTR